MIPQQTPHPFYPLMNGQQSQTATIQPFPFQFNIYQPPTFSVDKYDGSTDIKDFIKSFRAAAIVSRWSTADQVSLLEAYLTGCALDTFRMITDKSNVEQVFKLLLEKHGRSATQYLDEFNKLEPKHNETPRSFAHKLKQLIDDALPDSNASQKEILLKNRFIHCLPESNKSVVIYNSKNQSFIDTVEAVELALPKFNQTKQLEQIDVNYQYINQYNNRRQQHDANRPLPPTCNTPQRQTYRNNNYNNNNKRFVNKVDKFTSCLYCGLNNHSLDRCNLKRKHDEEKERIKNRQQQRHYSQSKLSLC